MFWEEMKAAYGSHVQEIARPCLDCLLNGAHPCLLFRCFFCGPLLSIISPLYPFLCVCCNVCSRKRWRHHMAVMSRPCLDCLFNGAHPCLFFRCSLCDPLLSLSFALCVPSSMSTVFWEEMKAPYSSHVQAIARSCLDCLFNDAHPCLLFRSL